VLGGGILFFVTILELRAMGNGPKKRYIQFMLHITYLFNNLMYVMQLQDKRLMFVVNKMQAALQGSFEHAKHKLNRDSKEGARKRFRYSSTANLLQNQNPVMMNSTPPSPQNTGAPNICDGIDAILVASMKMEERAKLKAIPSNTQKSDDPESNDDHDVEVDHSCSSDSITTFSRSPLLNISEGGAVDETSCLPSTSHSTHGIDWSLVSVRIGSERSAIQCRNRWTLALKPKLHGAKQGTWSEAEV
jgi:hypothetical protein